MCEVMPKLRRTRSKHGYYGDDAWRVSMDPPASARDHRPITAFVPREPIVLDTAR